MVDVGIRGILVVEIEKRRDIDIERDRDRDRDRDREEIYIEIGHRLVMLFVAPNSNQHCVGGIDGDARVISRRIEVADGWRSRLTN
jgi:hypothetical protein